MIQDTSKRAWLNEIRDTVGPRQMRVLEAFENGGEFTNSELAARLQWSINRITPRVKELREKGLLEDSGKRECAETHREVHAWRMKQPQIGELRQETSVAPIFHQFASRTAPKGIHTVRNGTFGLECTCKGFYYRKDCSHVQKAILRKRIEKHEENPVMATLF